MLTNIKLALWVIPITLSFTATTGAIAQPLGDTQTPIKIAINEWTGQQLTAHIAGKLLEKLGYKVEYVTAGTLPQFTGIASGTLHLSPEVWPSNLGEVYPKALAEGKLEEIGELGLQSRDGWIYTVDTKVGLSGAARLDSIEESILCSGAGNTGNVPKRAVARLSCRWGSVSGPELKNANIPFTPVPAGSEGALIAELQAAVAAHKPLLMRFWSPHWVLAEVPVEWLEMPPCDPTNLAECIVAPPVIKVVWSGFAQKWPAGYALMKSLQVHADDQQKMIYAVDKQGKNLDQAVDSGWISIKASGRAGSRRHRADLAIPCFGSSAVSAGLIARVRTSNRIFNAGKRCVGQADG